MSSDTIPRKPDRGIPYSELLELGWREGDAYLKYLTRQYNESIRAYSDILDRIKDVERRENRAIHKGAFFQMLGLNQRDLENHDEAYRSFLLAYVEDVLNVECDREDEADRAPAATALLQWYKTDTGSLERIKKYVRTIKESQKWAESSDTEHILKQAIGRDKEPGPSKTPPKTERILEYRWRDRVFIGGSYRSDSLMILEEIKRIVRDSGFEPVFVGDYRFDEDDAREIYHHCLMILHTCRLAIFDVSFHSGQLMELPRVVDYEIPTMVLCDVQAAEDLTSMVKTMHDVDFTHYRPSDLQHLEKEVCTFLEKHRPPAR